MDLNFRQLRADEIEARISTVSDKGCSILLYKNARCDMNILDECVQPMNWQRDHKDLKGNMYAGIGIYDDEKGAWVWKWDCGTESYTEAQKGEASDSFKRAGFNWGIGRELYTAPFIWFKKDQCNIEKKDNGKATCYDTFTVNAIEYKGGKISYLKVTNNKTKSVYTHGKSKENADKQKDADKQDNGTSNPTEPEVFYVDAIKIKVLKERMAAKGVTEKQIFERYNVAKFEELTVQDFMKACSALERMADVGSKQVDLGL